MGYFAQMSVRVLDLSIFSSEIERIENHFRTTSVLDTCLYRQAGLSPASVDLVVKPIWEIYHKVH